MIDFQPMSLMLHAGNLEMDNSGLETTSVLNESAESADNDFGAVATKTVDDLSSEISSYQNKESLEKVKYAGPLSKPYLGITHSKDIKDPSALHGSCGLYNLGNTCFMNSGLQCIMASSPLVKFFLEDFTLDKGVQDTLMGRFYILLCKMWCGQFSVIYPNKFKDTLGLYHSQFQDYRQHDCQEFLALLLDTLHEQLNMMGSNLRCLPSNNTPTISSGTTPVIANPVITSLNNMDTSTPKPSVEWSVNSPFTQTSQCLTSQCTQSAPPACSNFEETTLTFQDCPQSEHKAVAEIQESVPEEKRMDVPDVFSSSDSVLVENSDVPSDSNSSSLLLSDAEHALNLKRLKLQAENSLCSVTSSTAENKMSTETVEQSNNICHSNSASLSTSSHIDIDSKNVICSLSECKSDNLQLNNHIRTSKLPPNLLDFYCKESKTLNTNVLINEYAEEIVSTDSEKFAKQDNRFHQQNEENNILQEVAGIMEEEGGDKSDKEQTSNSFGIKDVNLHANKKKMKLISKSCTNVLKNDYQVAGEYGMNNFKRIKMESTDSVQKCEVDQEMSKVNSEEKNIQIQALSKFNTCRNITDEASDNESCDSMEVEGDGFVEDIDSSEDDGNIASLNSIPTGASATSPKHHVCTQHDIDAANKAWEDYISDNNSIVVQSFQGQFKSTVVCFGCHHTSVMYEPFMYLSLPIPRAMERQMCVIFVASEMPPVRYLLNMNKHDNVEKLKKQLLTVIRKPDCDIVLAEVLDSHISRILDDNILLRYVNDSSRKIYAFEIASLGTSDITSQSITMETSSSTRHSSTSEKDSVNVAEPDIFTDIGTFSVTEARSPTALFTDSKPEYQYSSVQNCQSTTTTTTATSHVHPVVSSPGSIDLTDSCVAQTDSVNTRKYDHEDLAGTGMWEWSSVGLDSEPLWDQPGGTAEESTPSDVGTGSAGILDQWRSCAICLEELSDSELLVHTCGGTFCQSCLEMSMKHSNDLTYCCPICLTPASVEDDFLPLAHSGSLKHKQRVIAIPIAFRMETSDKKLQLFGHPNILYLPNTMSAQLLYQKIDSLLPHPAVYTIVLTDGQGLHCSRCMYTTHCSGCALDREGEVTLQPSDHLTVQVENVLEDQIEDVERVREHESMEDLRQNEQITIYDCFRAFTQSEVLDEHNPWYCPQCKQNQCAKKTMTVWRYPDCLIVHLKRFVFHDFSSLKIDNRVIFPHKNLDLRDFISGPTTKDLTYDLYSIVCHFGGAHSGHYSSYSRHPLTSEWFYYNDDTITQQTPREDDYSSAYVLFYERQGTHSDINPSECLPRMVIEEESAESSMLNNNAVHGPVHSDSVLYGPQTYEAACYGPLPLRPSTLSGQDCDKDYNRKDNGASVDSKSDSPFDFYS